MMSKHSKSGEKVSRQPWRLVGWSFAAALLMVPLIAMQFTREVAWSGGDFLLAAILLGGTGLMLELAVRQSQDKIYQLAAVTALLTALLMLWIQLAVGIIGSEQNAANGWYLAVYLIGLLGAAASRLRSGGMAATLAAMATAQVAITLGAILTNAGGAADSNLKTIALNGVFIASWLVYAGLFLWAARRERHRAKH